MQFRANWRYLRNCFRILCLVATGALFVRGGWKYLANESSSLITFETFQRTEKDTYPSVSICTWTYVAENMLGIYDRKKLNETYNVHDPWEYIKFLEGDIWEERMLGIKYDDVTIDIRDRIETIEVYGMNYQVLYMWVRNKNETNTIEYGSDSRSMPPQISPMRISYRGPYGKCVSLDLSAEKMPQIEGQLISFVHIKFSNIRIDDVMLQYVINYPGQIFRGFVLNTEFAWNLRITTGYVRGKLFFVDIMEVFRKRNTFQKPCKQNWKDDDETIMRDVIKRANCRPPHWNVSVEYPFCDSKERMKKVYIPNSPFKIASPTVLESFVPPCDGLLSATLNTVKVRRNLFSSLTGISNESNSATVGYHFLNQHYKEVKYTRAFDIESLIGNVGGYIGLFLGFAIWQLPDAVEFLSSKWNALFGGRSNNNHGILCGYRFILNLNFLL